MTNLANRPPLGLKLVEPRKSPEHLARVAALPCVICHYWPVEVHHCIHDRFGTRKASDFDTIPLCAAHHREGPDAIHNGKDRWREHFGADHEYLPVVADMLAGEWNR